MSCENPLLLAITMLQDYKGDLAGREFPNTDEGNHLQVINENKRASVDAAIAGLHQLRAGMAAPAPVLVPDNLLSHRASWQRAFQRLIELEPASSEPDRDDRGYWKHEAQAMQDMYRDVDSLLADEQRPTVQMAIPDECPHMITFDDADRSPLIFAGAGARQAALKAWEVNSISWNAHLFVRIERNSRDDRYPSAEVAPSQAVLIQNLAADLELLGNQGWVLPGEHQPADGSQTVWCYGTYEGQHAPTYFEGIYRHGRWYCLNNGDYIDGGYGDDYEAQVILWRPLPMVPAQLLRDVGASTSN